jgi:pimeloyl-ACP methyl ester carboxylesterase
MTTRAVRPRRRSARLGTALLSVAVSLAFLASCSRTGTDRAEPADPPARGGDLYQVDGETAHPQCQGVGSPTVVFLGGKGFTTTTWAGLRSALGSKIRTCAWDYPGVGHSTGTPMMTAAKAASSLHGTLHAAHVPRPVILVGHSAAGLTSRLYVGQHPADVAGVVLLDPTVASFARMFDEKEFRPEWDGAASATQVERVTSWPDIPFKILLHDPAVYATEKIWSADMETRWGADEAAFSAPYGTVQVVEALATTSTLTSRLLQSLQSGACSTLWPRHADRHALVLAR